jgi:hypothetical protein
LQQAQADDDDIQMKQQQRRVERSSAEFIGTVNYLAPEVILERKYGTQGDWWAFGVTMYECITQNRLFDGDDFDSIVEKIIAESHVDLTPLAKFNPSASLHDLVSRLLVKAPEARLGSANNNTRSRGTGTGAEADAIKNHVFFRDARWNWETLSNYDPAYKPSQFVSRRQQPRDVAYFYGTEAAGGGDEKSEKNDSFLDKYSRFRSGFGAVSDSDSSEDSSGSDSSSQGSGRTVGSAGSRSGRGPPLTSKNRQHIRAENRSRRSEFELKTFLRKRWVSGDADDSDRTSGRSGNNQNLQQLQRQLQLQRHPLQVQEEEEDQGNEEFAEDRENADLLNIIGSPRRTSALLKTASSFSLVKETRIAPSPNTVTATVTVTAASPTSATAAPATATISATLSATVATSITANRTQVVPYPDPDPEEGFVVSQ